MTTENHLMGLRRFISGLALLVAQLLLTSAAFAANVIQLENAKAGTTAWKLDNPAQNREIEGYASLTSVNRGSSIALYVNTSAPSYTISVYRFGWYGGAGARQVLGPIARTGTVQPMPSGPDANGVIECNWLSPYPLAIPRTLDSTDWASGVYLAKLTAGGSGLQSYIIFTVRDDARVSDLLFQSSVNTWQAYNAWGGQSLYAFNSGGTPARKVSFNRPYDKNQGTGDFLGVNGYGWEPYMLRFLEREGYDVTYATNVDLHEKGLPLLTQHKAFLSVGHDEYWTYGMKSAIHQARDQGTHLGYFGADAVYWQVRFENSIQSLPASNRTVVGYKEAAQGFDPYAIDGDPTNDKFITARFRDLAAPPYNVIDPIARPENDLIGVMYHGDPFDGDIIVSDMAHWAYSGTGVANGSHFRALLGYENDSKFDNGFGPTGLQTIAESPDTWGNSHMSTYFAASGAVVFSTGSMQWLWGIDDFNVPSLRPSRLDPAAQQVTRNVLARFTAAPLGLPPIPAFLQAVAGINQISLSWSPVAQATSYNVYRSVSPGSQGVTPYRTGVPAPAFVDATPATGLTNYYRVTSVNASGESLKSNEASATPLVAPAPSPPTALVAAPKGANIGLTWTQSTSPGVVSNRVFRSTTNGGPHTLVATFSSMTSYTDNQATKKTTYYYVVAAVNGDGLQSAASGQATATAR